MSEKELLDSIDEGINTFKKNEGYQKRIKVSSKAKSDWLVFNWRQLTWERDGLNYLLEIFPNFDKNENITSWTLYSAVYYDSNMKRFYRKEIIAEKTTLEFIASNILLLLVSGYKRISNIKKEDIQFAVNLRG